MSFYTIPNLVCYKSCFLHVDDTVIEHGTISGKEKHENETQE